MQEQNYALLMQSCEDQQVYLGKLLTYIFTDSYIAAHPHLRRMIESNSKGFIASEYILTLPQIGKYFDRLELEEESERNYFLKATIGMYCPDLLWRAGKIRRVLPWRRNNLQKIKPLCVEDCQNNVTIADLRHFFGQDCFISPLKYDGWINNYLVYSKSPPEQLYLIDGRLPFKIMSYSSICKDIERQTRLLNSNQMRKYTPIQHHYRKQQPQLEQPLQVQFESSQIPKPFTHPHNRPSSTRPPLSSHHMRRCNLDYQQSVASFNELIKQPNECLNILLSMGFLRSASQIEY